jgi:hypothetical protein
MSKLTMLVLAGLGALVYSQQAEIRRYLQIKGM